MKNFNLAFFAVLLFIVSCSRNPVTKLFNPTQRQAKKDVGMLATYPTVNEQVRTFLDFKKIVTCRPTLMSSKVLNEGYSTHYASEYAGIRVWRNDIHPKDEGTIKVHRGGKLFCNINSVGSTDILYYDRMKMLLVFGEYANEAHLKIFNLKGGDCFTWGWVGFSKDPSIKEGILDYLNQLPLCRIGEDIAPRS